MVDNFWISPCGYPKLFHRFTFWISSCVIYLMKKWSHDLLTQKKLNNHLYPTWIRCWGHDIQGSIITYLSIQQTVCMIMSRNRWHLIHMWLGLYHIYIYVCICMYIYIYVYIPWKHVYVKQHELHSVCTHVHEITLHYVTLHVYIYIYNHYIHRISMFISISIHMHIFVHYLH